MTTATQVRDFPLGVVLSITTERQVATQREIVDLLNWMCGAPVLPWHDRADDLCRPAIRNQHPTLPTATPDGLRGKDECLAWVAQQAAIHGETVTIHALPPGTFTPPEDQIGALIDKYGPRRVFAFDVSRDPEEVAEEAMAIMAAPEQPTP